MTLSPRPARPRPRAGAWLLLAALAGGAVVAWRALGSKPDAPVPEGEGPAATTPSTLTGTGAPRIDEVDPWAPPGPLSGDEARAGLASRLSVRRVATLKDLAARGTSDPEIVSLVRAALADPDPLVALHAQAALVRVAGDRRPLVDLARAAARAPAFEVPADLLATLAPVEAPAMLAAARLAEGRDPPAGLAAALEALALDPERGRLAVVEGLRGTDAEGFAAWGEVAGALRPVPAAAVEHLMARGERGTAAEREAVAAWLSKATLEATSLPRDFGGFLASRLTSPDAREAVRWEAVVARLPSLPASVADALLDRARGADVAGAHRALHVLASLGPKAMPAGGRLVDLVRSLPVETQAMAVLSLAAVGGPEITGFAAQRLAGASPNEQAQWLEALRPSAAAAGPVVDPFARLARGADEDLALRAASALARWSAAVAAEGGDGNGALHAAAAEALGDPRATVRARVVGALRDAPAWATPVVVALARAVDDPDPAVAEAAAEAVSGAWRLGAAGAPLAPVLVRLSAATTPSSRRPHALRSLAAVAPEAPEARVRFVEVARDAQADAESRVAAVYGLSRLAAPTAEEREALLAHADRPETKALVAATRRKPGWRDPAPPGGPTSPPTSPASASPSR